MIGSRSMLFGVVLGASAAACPQIAEAQVCSYQCFQVLNQVGQSMLRCAQYGCGSSTIQRLNQYPARYPPNGTWRPYQAPPGYYRPRFNPPGVWRPSRRY